MVKIRLARHGKKKKPFYRMVVVDSRSRRDGPFIEMIGTYDPMKEPSVINVDVDRANHWIGEGAQVSATVKRLIEKATSEAV